MLFVVKSGIITAIEPLVAAHYEEVKSIYAEGIATGQATLNTTAPNWNTWDKEHLAFARFIAIAEDKVAGWAALSPVSGRCVYSGVAEVSIYIGAAYRGQGIGKELLQHLVSASEENGIWTLQAGIIKENTASVALHQVCGFRIVGLREKLGQLHGVWRDTYLLERRSTVVGV